MLPKASCDVEGADLEFAPPEKLIAGLMKFAMVATAEWHGKFVTHLETDRVRLRKTQMVRIGWLASADETGLGRDKLQVLLVAQALGFRDGELALVDAAEEVMPAWGKRGGDRCRVHLAVLA